MFFLCYFIFHIILQRVGDEENDEAEAMIRAITHGEIDNAVYSKMADDLESAAQIKRKAGKPKKKKTNYINMVDGIVEQLEKPNANPKEKTQWESNDENSKEQTRPDIEDTSTPEKNNCGKIKFGSCLLALLDPYLDYVHHQRQRYNKWPTFFF